VKGNVRTPRAPGPVLPKDYPLDGGYARKSARNLRNQGLGDPCSWQRERSSSVLSGESGRTRTLYFRQESRGCRHPRAIGLALFSLECTSEGCLVTTSGRSHHLSDSKLSPNRDDSAVILHGGLGWGRNHGSPTHCGDFLWFSSFSAQSPRGSPPSLPTGAIERRQLGMSVAARGD
jgi:hypothetical protein